MKVIQRNFRKYQQMREWGWFIIIQKTRPLIGQVNMEQMLRNLEEKVEIIVVKFDNISVKVNS